MIKCEVFYDSESLKKDLRLKRIIELELNMDECSKRIGISKSTLSRIENGSMPDLLNFLKIVKWLEKDIKEYVKL
jgi:transcriptional regulator with XRE-family HTH domain